MIIKKVGLVNFRIHEQYVLECEDETSLILGENGCGKTSVLEAIYEACRGKSFRAVDREIVRRGADFYRIEVEYIDGEKIVVTYDNTTQKKNFIIGGRKWARLPKKYKYPVVLFLPDDLHLVASSPTHKRDYFDRILAELDSGYSDSLSKYNKTLKQRNELLKSDYVAAEMLFSWNILLARYGVELRRKRAEFVAELNGELTDTYRSIAENEDEVTLDYLYDSVSESAYLARLETDFQRDCVLGHTGYGMHRDNYNFIFNGVDADGSASRGEVRSMILAMKFIEAKLVSTQTGRRPIILLDDVFSELDAKRQECLVKNFKNNQVIITSVEKIEN